MEYSGLTRAVCETVRFTAFIAGKNGMNDSEKRDGGRWLAMMLRRIYIYLFAYYRTILRWPLLCIISDGSRNAREKKIRNRSSYQNLYSFFFLYCGYISMTSVWLPTFSSFDRIKSTHCSFLFLSLTHERDQRWPSGDHHKYIKSQALAWNGACTKMRCANTNLIFDFVTKFIKTKSTPQKKLWITESKKKIFPKLWEVISDFIVRRNKAGNHFSQLRRYRFLREMKARRRASNEASQFYSHK